MIVSKISKGTFKWNGFHHVTTVLELLKFMAPSYGITDFVKIMKEAEANAEADKKAKESIEKVNQADSLIFQTEKQLKEYGDKLPAEKKEPIESALAELKSAHESKDIDAIDASMAKLNEVFQAASQEMYQAQQDAQGGQPQGEADAGNAEGGDEEVTDVDFEEVEEK